MKTQLIHKHFMEGGTGITNIDEKDLQDFLDAIHIYHWVAGRHELVISDVTIEAQCRPGVVEGHSLHQLQGDDLSAFWQIFDVIAMLSATERNHHA